MFQLSKKADYGLIALKHLAQHAEESVSARQIADHYHIPAELLAKVLQRLVRKGLLVSQQGMNGGYVLARNARNISALEVIRAIDGPLFITSCGDEKHGCYQSPKCNVREPLRKVNESIQQVLTRISIADMREHPQEAEDTELKSDRNVLVTLSTQ